MNKIPSIFLRDFDSPGNPLTQKPNPECQWVFDGEGTATRKYDGTCMMFDGSQWWARREIKEGKERPANFVEVEQDDATGKVMGWVPMEPQGYWHPFLEAIGADGPGTPEEIQERIRTASESGRWLVGTYELCGPKISRNPEGVEKHTLFPHATEHTAFPNLPFETYSFEEFKATTQWLHEHHGVEGIVWHHPDGRMAKIKARDFR